MRADNSPFLLVADNDTGRGAEPRWFTICEACDGEGDDGDILWPTRCGECSGTGLVSTDLEDGEVLL